MAGRLSLRFLFIGLAVAGAGASTVALGENLPDPTRPPAGFIETVGHLGGASGRLGGGGLDGAADGAAKDAGANETNAAPFRLQSVLLPRRGRPLAIISGKYVPLGERYQGMELVSVSEKEVVLAAGKQRRVLKLTPGVEKTRPVAGQSAAGRQVAVAVVEGEEGRRGTTQPDGRGE